MSEKLKSSDALHSWNLAFRFLIGIRVDHTTTFSFSEMSMKGIRMRYVEFTTLLSILKGTVDMN